MSKLVDLPLLTFGDIKAAGLVLNVSCPHCKSTRRREISAELLGKRFAGRRFRCGSCGRTGGYPSIEPPQRIGVDVALERAFLCCSVCVPPWQIVDVRFSELPWSLLDRGAGRRWRCPGCRHPVDWHWYGQATPGTGPWRAPPAESLDKV